MRARTDSTHDHGGPQHIPGYRPAVQGEHHSGFVLCIDQHILDSGSDVHTWSMEHAGSLRIGMDERSVLTMGDGQV